MRTEAKEIVRETRGTRTGAVAIRKINKENKETNNHVRQKGYVIHIYFIGKRSKGRNQDEEEEKESGGGEGKGEVAFATCSGVSAARYSIMISRRDYLMFTDSLLAGA